MAPALHEKIGFFAERTGSSTNQLVIDALDKYLRELVAEVEALTN